MCFIHEPVVVVGARWLTLDRRDQLVRALAVFSARRVLVGEVDDPADDDSNPHDHTADSQTTGYRHADLLVWPASIPAVRRSARVQSRLWVIASDRAATGIRRGRPASVQADRKS